LHSTAWPGPGAADGGNCFLFGEQFSEFDIYEVERRGIRSAVMEIRPVHIALIFVRPGTYDVARASGLRRTIIMGGDPRARARARACPADEPVLIAFA
jgi:hypothetical protein